MAFNIAQSSRLGRRLLHSSARLLSAAEPSKSVQAEAIAQATTSTSSSSSVIRPDVPSLPRHQIQVGPTHQSRYEEHYNNSLARDLLYMTYDHSLDLKRIHEEAQDTPLGRSSRSNATWDLTSPYTKNRPERPNRGHRSATPSAVKYADQVVELDRVVLTSFSPEAVQNKHALIPLLALMRAITGKPIIESAYDPQVAGLPHGKLPTTGYVRLIHSKKNVQAFKQRKGAPVGVQAVLPRKSAYEFLEVFTTFVLPRLRGFNGFALPPPGQAPNHAAAVSGVVSLGMDAKYEAFGIFPQTEVNWDNYPFRRAPGFQVDCITNQRGPRATEKARQMLSGLGVPFVRRGEA